MLSGVLRSDRAIEVNIEIMRTFVRLRYILAEHKDFKSQLAKLEKRYDKQFQVIFQAIRKMIDPEKPAKKQQLGFGREKK